jgi:hypothetical protein
MRSGILRCVNIMEDTWQEMGEEIVQHVVDYTDWWRNDLTNKYLLEDRDPANINWDEIFYEFLERFMKEAHTADADYIHCSRVLFGEKDFIVDTEHLGGYHRTIPADLEDALKVGSGVGNSEMTSWTYSDDAYLDMVFGIAQDGDFIDNSMAADKVVINAIVAIDDVDWPTTIANNLSPYWKEYELVIPHNTPVYDIDILRNGEPMVTMEETKAAEWSNATITSSVHEMIDMMKRDKNTKKKTAAGSWAADTNERMQRAKDLGKQWNKDVDKDTLDAAKKGAKSDYVGQWKRTPKLPKYPPAGQSWCGLKSIYEVLEKQDQKRKSKYKRLGTAIKPPQQFVVTDGTGIGNQEFVTGPRGTDVAFSQYQRKCNGCGQAWVASQKDVDNSNKAKERCWKCGVVNNYKETKADIAYREIKFPVTTPGCNDTVAYVSLTGEPARKLESVLRPGSVIEIQGWIKPNKEWKYKNTKKYLVDALLITLGSTQHGGYVKLIKR